MAVHLHPHTVRFGECDPAGVVYFPVFFDWFHQAMESWFAEGLGHVYADILQRYGFPAVKPSAEFRCSTQSGQWASITAVSRHTFR